MNKNAECQEFPTSVLFRGLLEQKIKTSTDEHGAFVVDEKLTHLSTIIVHLFLHREKSLKWK